MTLRIYDDTTHQVVPLCTPKMARAGRAELTHLGFEDVQFDDSQKVYHAMLSAAPPHGAAMPTREEIADAIYRVTIKKASVGRITTHVVMTLEAADAILALIQERMKP